MSDADAPALAKPDPAPVLLVVDDDASIRRALGRLLTSAGYAVETFGSAQELLAREPLTGPGCLILDVRMPGLSGAGPRRISCVNRARWTVAEGR